MVKLGSVRWTIFLFSAILGQSLAENSTTDAPATVGQSLADNSTSHANNDSCVVDKAIADANPERTCYTCNSVVDPQCESMSNKTYIKRFEFECDETKSFGSECRPFGGCRKQVQYVGKGDIRIHRSCMYHKEKKNGQMRNGINDVAYASYECPGTLCNGALSFNVFWGLILVLTVAVCKIA